MFLRLRPSTTILGFILALAGCAADQPLHVAGPPPEVSRNIGPYRDAVEQRRYAVAVAGLRPIVQAHPDHVDAKLTLAAAYFGQADIAQAQRLYTEAEPQSTTPRQRGDARAGRGLIALYQGDTRAAEQHFRDALTDDRGSALAWNGLGQSLDRQGRHDEAKSAFGEALQHRPGWTVALNNLGLAYLHAGDYAGAERVLMQARQTDPRSSVVANNLRLAIALQGRYEEALAGVEPDGEADALNNVGYAAMVRGDLAAASRYLHQAQIASPSFHAEADRNLRLLETLRNQRGGTS